ncbi:Hypothetical predicted protein [Octopus vulgaris]|uniref:Uncharacterized protein n=1 Tax=Octopus vulgaris TaxID=6645 RepID=A0AA36B5H0_OCTVU|nr:Hypothetical predicted protein [Octopus vulgaris]
MDEKKFMVDELANRQSPRVKVYDPSQVPLDIHSKHLASIKVFGAFANEGKLMPPYFIEAVLKINTAEYLQILEVLLPSIRKHYDEKTIPDRWKHLNTAPIYKRKGDCEEYGNSWGISHLDDTDKILSRILLRRLLLHVVGLVMVLSLN